MMDMESFPLHIFCILLVKSYQLNWYCISTYFLSRITFLFLDTYNSLVIYICLFFWISVSILLQNAPTDLLQVYSSFFSRDQADFSNTLINYILFSRFLPPSVVHPFSSGSAITLKCLGSLSFLGHYFTIVLNLLFIDCLFPSFFIFNPLLLKHIFQQVEYF